MTRPNNTAPSKKASTPTPYSVLMSVYRKDVPAWLSQSIESMLKQTIKPDEFVIVEDGKLPTEIERIITEYKTLYPKLFKIIKLEQNQGLGPALAAGVKACKNELIARMDSDDYSEPNRIEKQLALLALHPDLSIIGTNVNEFTTDIQHPISYVKLPEQHADIVKFSKQRCPFRHPSLLYKKSAVLTAGNYRNFPFYEDYDLYIRLIKSGAKCHNIQEPLTYMRIGPDFYKRRGGIKYLTHTLSFKNSQLKEGYFTLAQYLHSTAPHLIVCLLPNAVREKIYKNLLRAKATNHD